jgi:selenide,water dikinase
MAVTGIPDPQRLLRNDAGRAGVPLSLTKPLGIGVLNNRHKATGEVFEQAVATMVALNREASEAALAAGITCATDVTGFGLLGHLHNMLAASGVSAEIDAASVPLFPNAVELAERGAIPGGTKRNRDALSPEVKFGPEVPEPIRVLLFDAQTSGGLLIAVDPDRAGVLVAALEREGTPAVARIGRLTRGVAGAITVT